MKRRMTGTCTCERSFRGSDDCVALRGYKYKRLKKVFSFPFLVSVILCLCVCTLMCFAALFCLLL